MLCRPICNARGRLGSIRRCRPRPSVLSVINASRGGACTEGGHLVLATPPRGIASTELNCSAPRPSHVLHVTIILHLPTKLHGTWRVLAYRVHLRPEALVNASSWHSSVAHHLSARASISSDVLQCFLLFRLVHCYLLLSPANVPFGLLLLWFSSSLCQSMSLALPSIIQETGS